MQLCVSKDSQKKARSSHEHGKGQKQMDFLGIVLTEKKDLDFWTMKLPSCLFLLCSEKQDFRDDICK